MILNFLLHECIYACLQLCVRGYVSVYAHTCKITLLLVCNLFIYVCSGKTSELYNFHIRNLKRKINSWIKIGCWVFIEKQVIFNLKKQFA